MDETVYKAITALAVLNKFGAIALISIMDILLNMEHIKKDPDAWRRSFRWPISDAEWFALGEGVFDRFEAAYATLNDEGRDLLLSDFNFLNPLLLHLHLLLADRRMRENGFRIVGGDSLLSIDWRAVGREYDDSPPTNKWVWIRSIVKNLVFNGRLGVGGVLRWFIGFSRPLGIGTVTPIKNEYLQSKNIVVQHRYLEELIDNRCISVSTEATAVAQILCREIADFARNIWDVHLNADAAGYAWGKRLSRLAGIYRVLAKQRRFPAEIYVTDVAKPLVKLFCLAARRQGSQVMGFSHGNDFGMLQYRVTSYLELSHFDDFFMPTSAAAQSAAARYKLSGMWRFCPVRFLSTNSKYYLQLAQKCASKSLPMKTLTVMLMGYPMNNNRCLDDVGAYYLIQLELELRLVELLKKEGFRVIYKGHPDRRAEVSGVFDGRVDAVEFRYFEHTWFQADVLLFTYPGTTTFGFALCTNRPIVLLNHIDQKWDPVILKELQKRCLMVPTYFDECNRINFRTDHLIEALQRRATPPDLSVIKRYMAT